MFAEVYEDEIQEEMKKIKAISSYDSPSTKELLCRRLAKEQIKNRKTTEMLYKLREVFEFLKVSFEPWDD